MDLRYSLAFLFCILLFSINIRASHVIGGYFNYSFANTEGTDSVSYNVEFRMYRDCLNANPGPGTELPDIVPITVFNSSNVVVSETGIARDALTILADTINNPCLIRIDSICVQEGIYRGVITLSRNEDLRLVYQRCCRNSIIDNIVSPSTQGNSFVLDIPAFDRVGRNSSPTFDEPTLDFMMCAGFDIRLDLSATDIDTIFDINGDTLLDSLAYSFCAPFDYPVTNNDPSPVPALAPPYNEILFQFPRTVDNPIPSNPFVRIDPISGIITGIPTNIGTYVIGVCVEEYRGGVLLSRTIRDIQITTGNCDPVITTTVQDQEQFCDGLEVQFLNRTSSATPGVNVSNFEYKWDFGDTTRTDDTSRAFSPRYTYDTTGIYNIILITNPGLPCSTADTNQFEVLDKLDPRIEMEGNFCVDANEIDFFVGGVFEDKATFEWDFGSAASIQQSTQDSVFDVGFTGSGIFPIQLRAFQDNCTVTVDSILTLIDNPVVDFSIDDSIGCPQHTVNFTDRSAFSGTAQFFWDVGDNNTILNDQNPVHTYSDLGFYNIGLLILTDDGCVGQKGIDSAIEVTEAPTAVMENLPTALSMKEAVIDIDGRNSIMADSFLIKINNELIASADFLNYRFSDTGRHQVELIVFNEFECSDTSRREVLIFDEFEFVIPNVFTPNQDGINDEFKMQACGVYEYEISIFNRYGEKVFESNSLNINWDGKFRDRRVSSGVYFYTIRVLDFRNEYLDFNGTVTVLED